MSVNQSIPLTGDSRLITLPNGDKVTLPWFLPTPAALKEQQRIAAGTYFLVKIAGVSGEIWRCKRCHGKHRYLTLLCIEQPFSGLSGGLYALWHQIGAQGGDSFLSEGQRARMGAITRHLMRETPSLARSHPELVRKLGTPETGVDVGAWSFVETEPSELAVGVLEPVKRDKAADLVKRINLRAGYDILNVPGLVAA